MNITPKTGEGIVSIAIVLTVIEAQELAGLIDSLYNNANLGVIHQKVRDAQGSDSKNVSKRDMARTMFHGEDRDNNYERLGDLVVSIDQAAKFLSKIVQDVPSRLEVKHELFGGGLGHGESDSYPDLSHIK